MASSLGSAIGVDAIVDAAAAVGVDTLFNDVDIDRCCLCCVVFTAAAAAAAVDLEKL